MVATSSVGNGNRVELLRAGRDDRVAVDPRLEDEDDVVAGLRRRLARLHPPVGMHENACEAVQRGLHVRDAVAKLRPRIYKIAGTTRMIGA